MVASIQLSGLRGQQKAKKMLGQALAADRIPHAYMFRGPDGVGKRLFAMALAAAVNCHQPVHGEACGRCGSCRKFQAGSHPDFLLVQPDKGGIKIDAVRQMCQQLTYPPYESKKRIVVLGDVQLMRREAANSLLKTLEEPPEDNLLVLTGESSREILSTLVSRCQIVPFFALDLADTEAILVQKGIPVEDSRLLARLAEGCPGRALLYKDADMVRIWRTIVAVLLDPDKDAAEEVGELLHCAELMAALKDDLLPLLGLFRLWLRDMLFGEESDATAGNSAYRVKSWSSSELFAKLQAIDRAERALRRNCNRHLICEVLLFSLQQSPQQSEV